MQNFTALQGAIDRCRAAGATPIVTVRHGQTAANAERRFVGAMDVPLDDVGLAQAGQLADRLRGLSYSALYSSPLSRARVTASALGTPELDGALQELDQGDFEGRPAVEVMSQHPAIFEQWARDPLDVRVPGGETLRELRERALPAVLELGSRHDETIVVVSHQMVLATLVLTALDLPFRFLRHVRQGNTAVSVLGVRDGELSVHHLNDTDHLA